MAVSYFRLICSNEHKADMETAIQESGYEIRPEYPIPIFSTNKIVSMWVFELDVLYDYDTPEPKQTKLLELQKQYC